MKVASPRLLVQPTPVLFSDMEAEGELEGALISDQDATNLVISGLQLEDVVFDKVQLTAAHFERLGARDVVFKRSDLSSFAAVNGSINRGSFDNCRMIGADFNTSHLHDVTFRDCKLDMANFRFTDLRRVKFIDCLLTETDFLGATLHDVGFENCVLEKTVFEQVKCKQVDLRGSQLNEIVGWSSLKGVIIDDVQLMSVAPYLANELGIVVRSEL